MIEARDLLPFRSKDPNELKRLVDEGFSHFEFGFGKGCPIYENEDFQVLVAADRYLSKLPDHSGDFVRVPCDLFDRTRRFLAALDPIEGDRDAAHFLREFLSHEK